MDEYTIKKRVGFHAEGTKFYSVYEVKSTASSSGFVVTHSGAVSACPTRVPKNGARSILKEVNSHSVEWDADAIYRAKVKRGYSFDFPVTETKYSATDFLNALTATFKGADARRIYNAVCNGEGGLDMDTEVEEVFGTAAEVDHEVASVPKKPTLKKHEDWGSW